MTEVGKINDYSHLERLEDGKKAKKAKQAVEALRKPTEGHIDLLEEFEKTGRRRNQAYEKTLKIKKMFNKSWRKSKMNFTSL